MLGTGRFQFETPNVIDPGDLPPSTPSRRSHGSEGSQTSSTKSSSGCSEESMMNDAYQEARESTARLLQDIGDLDLTPDASRPYNPYDDDDEDDAETGSSSNLKTHQHSLPTVEEARIYAVSLLSSANEAVSGSSSPSADYNPAPRKKRLSRSRVIEMVPSASSSSSSSRHLVRNKLVVFGLKVFAACAVIIIVVVAGLAVVKRNMRRHQGAPPPPSTSSGTADEPSDQGSSSSSGSREQQIYDFLTSNDVTSADALNKADSPQHLAWNWMANVDVLQEPVPTALHTSQRFVQRYALATLFYATNGPNWKETFKFLSAQDECGWFDRLELPDYVAQETAVGVSCDADLRVRSLYLPNNRLQGTLPSELQFLTHLDMVGLPYNELTQSIPDGYRSLSQLAYLDLNYNMISGVLPEWLGDMDSLEVLGLSDNQLAGPVPPSLGTLARLKTLSLDDNALTGSLTNFANHLYNLEYLFVDRNLFTGDLDDSFLTQLTALRQLDVSFNNLRGDSIPLHLLQHETLEVLDLADLTLSEASFPELTQENLSLEFLSLRRTGLKGSLPASLSNLARLSHLDLFGNQLTGSLPNEIGSLNQLNYLFMGENPFTASTDGFAPLFAQLTNLRELSMTSTNLGGSIPAWLSYLGELRLLDLSNNRLEGAIPDSVWSLPQLSYFLAHDNAALTGQVPNSAQDQFKVVSLYNTGLTGDANPICQSNPDLHLLAVDCTMTCECCEDCCSPDDDKCLDGKVSTALAWFEGEWEYGFQRSAYSFDPAILVESGVATVVTEQP